MASVRFRNGRFEARVRVEGRNFSKSFDALDEARKWALGLEVGAIRPPARRGKPSPAMTFIEAAHRYLKEEGARHKGYRQEAERVRVLARLDWAGLEIAKVSVEHIRTLRDDMLNRGLSASTVRLMASLVSSIFEHARKELGLAIANPVREIRLPAPAPGRYRRLSSEEEKRLLHSLEQSRNPLMKGVVEFAIESGLRRSELLGLTWDVVNEKDRLITLLDTKNSRPRWIPLTPKALQILQAHRLLGLEKPFPVSVTALTQAWGHAVKRAKIRGIRYHDLRHEGLSRWAHRLNGDVFKIAAISGHKTLSELQKYVNPVQAEVMAAILNQAIDAA